MRLANFFFTASKNAGLRIQSNQCNHSVRTKVHITYPWCRCLWKLSGPGIVVLTVLTCINLSLSFGFQAEQRCGARYEEHYAHHAVFKTLLRRADSFKDVVYGAQRTCDGSDEIRKAKIGYKVVEWWGWTADLDVPLPMSFIPGFCPLPLRFLPTSSISIARYNAMWKNFSQIFPVPDTPPPPRSAP